jgi:hypothetical protein
MMKTLLTFAAGMLLLGACAKEDTWTTLLDKDLSQWEMYLSYAHKNGYVGEIPVNEQGDTIQPVGYNINKDSVFSVLEENQEYIAISEICSCVTHRIQSTSYPAGQVGAKWSPGWMIMVLTVCITHRTDALVTGEPGCRSSESWRRALVIAVLR